ncbi:MAG TPA: prepilin-type N-terminal cleavage/methylation domain-containing protein [Longimicrobiaceae bacterium]|nr:prepilin-type N-terminal cleavage/methylation domain-containing protein [Longimicrobiaceae bacterium]
MSSSPTTAERAGFPLIEILVVLLLVAALAAFVAPKLTQRVRRSDAPRTADDLQAIGTAVEAYRADTGSFPGDLEDLAFRPAITGDRTISGAFYTPQQAASWDGPYFDASLLANDASNVTGPVLQTGTGSITGALSCLAPDKGVETSACATGKRLSVALQLSGIDTVQFRRLDGIVDATEAVGTRSDRRERGRLRCVVSGSTCSRVYYLVTSYR